MINGDQLMADLRDIYFTRQADWLSFSDLVRDLKRQPYAAYHRTGFGAYRLKQRLDDFEIKYTRRGLENGVSFAALADMVYRFAPGPPRIVRLAKKEETEDGPRDVATKA